MLLIYFLYGLSVFLLGVVLSLQLRSPLHITPGRSTWHLALFGLSHGAAEWIRGARLTLPQYSSPILARLDPFLAGISFFFLLGFGMETLVALEGWPKRRLYLLGLLLGAWLLLAFRMVPDKAAEFESVSRYALAFPGSLLAARALWLIGRVYGHRRGTRIETYLKAGSAAFLLYGVFAGLVVGKAPFFPADRLNAEAFQAAFGLPVMIPRMLCIAAAAGLLAEAFVVEVGVLHDRIERMRRQFISMVAHDLRGPLTNIRMSCEAMKAGVGGGPGRPPADYFRLVEHSVDNLERMIGDFFDASVIEAHQLSLVKSRFDLKALCAELSQRSPRIRLACEDAKVEVWADHGRISQVLENLLSNAEKYSAPGTEILLSVERSPRQVRVAVLNRGPGIAEAEHEAIFSIFQRAEGSERTAPGTGLGLYIVRGIVEQHGGKAWVESSPQGPTVFRFTLPLQEHERLGHA